MGKITIRVNTKGLKISERIPSIEEKKIVLRDAASGVIHLMTQRIHIRGEKAAGGSIGTYSDRYMKVREANNRSDPKTPIIFALTEQLYRSWTAVGTDRGYGVGFQGEKRLGTEKTASGKNTENKKQVSNAELVGFLKERYPGVFILSDEERTFAVDYIRDLYLEAIHA